MNDYEKFQRAMRLIFQLDITPDDFLALQQLTVLSESELTEKLDADAYYSTGDLFTSGCQAVNDDLMNLLCNELRVTSAKESDMRNVCKAILDTVAFHIKR